MGVRMSYGVRFAVALPRGATIAGTVMGRPADAQVKRVDRFEKNEPLVWEPVGGGDTNFCPALEAIENEGTAVCALCITDLRGKFPESCFKRRV